MKFAKFLGIEIPERQIKFQFNRSRKRLQTLKIVPAFIATKILGALQPLVIFISILRMLFFYEIDPLISHSVPLLPYFYSILSYFNIHQNQYR